MAARQRESDRPGGDFVAAYERNQAHNRLFTRLQSLRFRRALHVIDAVAAGIGGRRVRVIDVGCGYAKLFALLSRA